MPDFIITTADFDSMQQNQEPIPAGFELKCRTKAAISRVLNTGNRADGILLRIIKRASGKPDIRVSKYFNKQDLNNGFAVLRSVLETKMLRGSFDNLNIYIYTTPSKSLIIAGSEHACNESGGGEGGEGVKVRIPT
ncbi:hypothetical protein [Dyadobacter sp. CY326]|uniref:hypothetical protein n=1 Tax=Dyadobacter sp. CY326 TaxID=2907300 RepID=UPI001F482CB4|nr:hypothetical protein [Dyadobacter sp. CY326]MCE7064619.1 hypothetical protein [Dyadobacter sp. CY326]